MQSLILFVQSWDIRPCQDRRSGWWTGSLFVQSSPGRSRWFGDGAVDGLEPLTNHVSAQQVAFLCGQLLGVLFLQMRGLRQNEQFIHQRPVHTREEPDI